MTHPAVKLLQDLIRCPSVTPAQGGALDLLEKVLSARGFTCHRLPFSAEGTPDVDNLYARWGSGAPHFCFAGHTDVVPPGDESGWTLPPFGGDIRDGHVWGRGAADMKGGIAAFVQAAFSLIDEGAVTGSLSLLITGDEEGPAVNGTVKVVDWLKQRGEKIDLCLVGEPTSREVIGDMVKIGRRGSFMAHLTVRGKQGHVAYPHLADNPVPKMVRLLAALDGLELDPGTEHFQPSHLEIVTVDVGNEADNVIPAACRAAISIRFNDLHTPQTLDALLRRTLDACGIPYDLQTNLNRPGYYCPPGEAAAIVCAAIEKETGRKPELSTAGGASDAPFIRAIAPVIEFGITGSTMHKVDERVLVAEMESLTRIYADILRSFFAQTRPA